MDIKIFIRAKTREGSMQKKYKKKKNLEKAKILSSIGHVTRSAGYASKSSNFHTVPVRGSGS